MALNACIREQNDRLVEIPGQFRDQDWAKPLQEVHTDELADHFDAFRRMMIHRIHRAHYKLSNLDGSLVDSYKSLIARGNLMTADYTRLRAVKAQLITDLQNLPFPVPTNVIEVMQADPETQRGYIRNLELDGPMAELRDMVLDRTNK